MEQTTTEVLEHYKAMVKEHGVGTVKGLGWSDTSVQEARFRVLLEGVRENDILQPVSMLDVGCGVGDIVNTYGFHSKVNKYTGVDFCAESIEYARNRYSNANNIKFYLANILDKSTLIGQEEVDYVLASGLFAYYKPYQISVAVNHMWELASKGIVFNVLVPRTLPFVSDLLTVLKVNGIDDWVLRHNYLTEDVTVYGYKD